MLNPFSPGVLVAAAIVSSPALWAAFADGTMAIDVALTRYLITVLVAWALLSIAKSYVISAHQETRRALQEIAAAERASAGPAGSSEDGTADPAPLPTGDRT